MLKRCLLSLRLKTLTEQRVSNVIR